jgi:gamma-aminobutyric acid receptor subunit beta
MKCHVHQKNETRRPNYVPYIRRDVLRALLLVVGVMFGLTGGVAWASTCVIPSSEVGARPDAAGVPTEISVGVYVLDIIGINNATQAFSADIHVTAGWLDKRLSEESLGYSLEYCRVNLNEIWHPYMGILNQRAMKKVFEDTVQIDGDGNVLYRQRAIGELTTPVDLKGFPFDSQMFSISMSSFRYDSSEVSLILDESRTGRLGRFSLAGWSIEPSETRITKQNLAPQNRSFDRLDYELVAERHRGYYLWKVFFPLALIVFMAWTVFWIDPSQLGAQVGVSGAAVFTLIAFQFSLGYFLPRVSYLTRADKYIFGSTILVFLALGEGILTSWLALNGRHELSKKIDLWSRVVYPILFALCIWIAFGINM